MMKPQRLLLWPNGHYRYPGFPGLYAACRDYLDLSAEFALRLPRNRLARQSILRQPLYSTPPNIAKFGDRLEFICQKACRSLRAAQNRANNSATPRDIFRSSWVTKICACWLLFGSLLRPAADYWSWLRTCTRKVLKATSRNISRVWWASQGHRANRSALRNCSH